MAGLLDMSGTVDDVFTSVPVTRIATAPGGYVDGIYVSGGTTTTVHPLATIQPVSERDIRTLDLGGERIEDMRKVYLNDGTTTNLTPADELQFLGQRWKQMQTDNRPWRNYCKCIVVRIDPQ